MTTPQVGAHSSVLFVTDSQEMCKIFRHARDEQGGIHPDFDGNTYLEILAAAKAGAPGVHVHAFSPLEVHQGAATLGWPLPRCRHHAQAALPPHVEALNCAPNTMYHSGLIAKPPNIWTPVTWCSTSRPHRIEDAIGHIYARGLAPRCSDGC